LFLIIAVIMMKRFTKFAPFMLAMMPMMVFAQGTRSSITGFLADVQAILNTLLPILVTIAVLAFFWGLAKFIFAAGDESAKAAGKNIMIWGIIALFIIVSIWGIIGLLAEIFGIGQGGSAPVPGVEEEAGTGGGTAPTPIDPGA
jgi:hypothetical protein